MHRRVARVNVGLLHAIRKIEKLNDNLGVPLLRDSATYYLFTAFDYLVNVIFTSKI